MARARAFNGDPRKCPRCGRKMLWARAFMIAAGDDTFYVHADRCNGCRTDQFKGELLIGAERVPDPQMKRTRVEALRSQARREKMLAESHARRAQELLEGAAQLMVEAQPGLSIEQARAALEVLE